jgi:hypothetical protein
MKGWFVVLDSMGCRDDAALLMSKRKVPPDDVSAVTSHVLGG